MHKVRLSTIDYAKSHCKVFQNIDKSRKYFGFAMLHTWEIISCKNEAFSAKLEYTPQQYDSHQLAAHCDIRFGIVINEGEPFPEELNELFERLRLIASKKLYIDPHPDDEKWDGNLIS